jgi:acetolactate synthase-1/2/3 large subunit
LLGAADAVLVVGSRFVVNPRLGVTLSDETAVIQIDIDPEQLGKTHPAQVAIEADAKAALGQLANLVPGFNRSRESREAELSGLKERTRQMQAQAELQAAYGMALREELPDDGIVVSESTQVGYWAQSGGFPVYEPRTFLTSGYQGTLGYGYATALGAQVGNPDKKVVSINGDGGFFYNVQELSTQAQQQIPLVTVVFNDNAFGTVRRMQVLKYNDHRIVTDLVNPDMVKMAESFGVAGYRAEGVDEFRVALRDALDANAPALIEVPVPPAHEIGIFPMQQEAPRPVLNL